MARMNPGTEIYDVIVAGAGAGGICAAVASARTGAKTLLVEKANAVGGTGVHSPVALICKFHGTDHRPVNMGLHRELFQEAYLHSTRDKRPQARRLTYDESILHQRYLNLISVEPNLILRTGSGVTSVERNGRSVGKITLETGETVKGLVYIDGTADAVLARLCHLRTMVGRHSDHAMQSATLTFTVEGFDESKLQEPDIGTRGGMESLLAELNELYQKEWSNGELLNPKSHVMAFPYPDGKRLLFNSNEVLGVDPTEERSVEKAIKKGKAMIDELFGIIQRHPAFASARISRISRKMGVREGPRVVGDYILSESDCLGEARFADMVAACAYELDIHDPDGSDPRMVDIPGSGYYHIPYRSLVAADADNFLMASRCISGSHEAFSSYRVMSGITAIGQAAGTAAALAAELSGGRVREVQPAWIRHELRHQLQFVEGTVEAPPRRNSGVHN